MRRAGRLRRKFSLSQERTPLDVVGALRLSLLTSFERVWLPARVGLLQLSDRS